MTRYLVLLIFVLLPTMAGAETVRVRSGEHADFSRLLLVFDARGQWTFGRVDGGYEFWPEADGITYDLSKAFEFIPRDRIADLVDLGDGRLFIATDCACHGDAFDLSDGQVVLDIKDGPPLHANAPFEARLAPLEPLARPDEKAEAVSEEALIDAAERRLSLLGPAARSGLPLIVRPGPVPESTAPQQAAPEPKEASNRPSATHGDPSGDVTAEPGDGVAETQAALLEQIARAAAQGLLEANIESVEDDLRQVELMAPDSSPPVQASPPMPLPPQVPRSHVSVETSIDRAATGRPAPSGEADDGTACIDPSLFDIAHWGGPVENGAALGNYRAQIVGEFDLANGNGLTDLARHYVFITFGAEAKALVRRFADKVERGDLLMIMADVMDAGSSDDAAQLAGQMACGGATALWAVLAQHSLEPGQPINMEAVALAFSALPPHLRRHLGPGLVEKLLAIGDLASADLIRNAVSRMPGAPPAELDMLSAQFDLAHGDVVSATARLDDVLASGDTHAPAALLERVEATLGAGQAVPADLTTLLESMAFERRGTPQAAPFIDAEIRALASGADFDTAFRRLEAVQEEGYLPSARLGVLREVLFAALAANGADATFLRLTVPRIGEAEHLSPDLRRQLAERSLDLGLPTLARRILGGDGALPEIPDRVLFARAAMLEARPDIAISYLAGLTDAGATELRGEALLLARDYDRAAQVFAGLDDTGALARTAWRGGLWPEVAALAKGPQREAALLMSGAAAMPDAAAAEAGAQPLTPLAQSQALIEKSRAARVVLDDLLAEFDLPAEIDMP